MDSFADTICQAKIAINNLRISANNMIAARKQIDAFKPTKRLYGSLTVSPDAVSQQESFTRFLSQCFMQIPCTVRLRYRHRI